MLKTAHEIVMEAKKSIRECPITEAPAAVTASNTLLIDVREPDEYRQGHIAGAINIPRGMLEFRISNEPGLQELDRPVVIYCKTSGRAALSAVALQQMGFTRVISLAGGFDAWLAAGNPVTQPRDIAYD
jgi:rhodanese-related sulfurtransferase